MSELNRVYLWNSMADVPQHDYNTPLNACQLIEGQLGLIEEEFNELEEAISNNDYEGVLDACGDLLVVVAGMLYRLDVTPEEALKRVNDSNFTKFLPPKKKGQVDKEYELLAYRTLANYKDDPRYYDIQIDPETGVVSGKTKSGHRKVLKAITYKEPDFSGLIKEGV